VPSKLRRTDKASSGLREQIIMEIEGGTAAAIISGIYKKMGTIEIN
jgi:hypothetical protein